MSIDKTEDRSVEAKGLIDQLKNRGMTPKDISEALDGRITRRTIYRWIKGDTVPQRSADVEALRSLVDRTSAS